MSDKLKIIVDGTTKNKRFNSEDSKSARNPFEGIVDKTLKGIIEVETETLSKNIGSACKVIAESISEIELNKSKYEIEKVSFSLVFDTNGGVSLLSTFSGDFSMQTGITITLSPKQNIQ